MPTLSSPFTAKFTVQAQAYTQDDANMACALIQIDFLRPGFSS